MGLTTHFSEKVAELAEVANLNRRRLAVCVWRPIAWLCTNYCSVLSD
jgi:hypothetical protein